ncbi:DNA replication/repair protein RecF [Chrysiogenes arsenatis]|uniref:DNA replication/repair protein RecF n=1 Tax=Chrysiogenes arsenatis TaxID=309797 RepID=UPI00041781F4|nr:DNA replication and repair protein RecF [Chrysiogenes arsenatis]
MDGFHVSLAAFRNIPEFSYTFEKGIYPIIGANGSGKTSFLEAIHVVANIRSFRTNVLKECIAKKEKSCCITLQENDTTRQIALFHDKKNILLNGFSPLNLTEYLQQRAVISLTPDDINLTDNTSTSRRKFFDRGIFYDDAGYLSELTLFQKILRHRNAVLRQNDQRSLPYWDDQYIPAATTLYKKRFLYFERLQQKLNSIEKELSLSKKIELFLPSSQKKSFFDDEQFRHDLHEKQADDLHYGYTSIGPHREEITLLYGGMNSGKYASYGEKRFIAIILKLAQILLMQEAKTTFPIILIDEMSAGLDHTYSKALLDIFITFPTTLIVTSTTPFPAEIRTNETLQF